MNKMKKITALLLCVIMVVYAPMTAFANSDMIGTDTTILETTTPTDPVVGCTECGGTDAHLETCSQYAAAAVVETATITLDSIPAGAIAENENVQGTKATITANPVSLYSSPDNGAQGVKLAVESGTVIDLIAKYTFTTDAGSQVFYMFDYYGTNKAFGDTAFSNRYISAEEISIQSAEDPGAIVDDVVPDSDVTEIIDPVTGLMVSGDIPEDLTLVASPKTLEESGIDTTVYPIDGPSLFYGVNLLLGNTGYMTFFSITVTFPEAAVAECGLTAGDSYNVYSIHDGVTDVTGPFVYSGGSISADFTNLGVMGIAKAAEEGNTPGGDVPEDETLVDLKALHGDAVVSYLDEEIEFQINPGTVTFYDGYESDVHAKETADTAGTEIEAFVEITYADGFVLYQYSYFGEDEAFKELVKYHQFISADDVTEITPEMKQPCAICGFKNCKTAHLYCEECKEFDCGVKHPKPEPIRPITKPELPSVEPEIPEGSDSVIVDAEGYAVTDGIQLYEGERVSFSAWSKLEEEGDVDYQWQICYDKKNDLWTNIQGQDEQGIVMSPAMVESIIDAVGSAVIRCQMTSGDVVQYSETIPVTIAKESAVDTLFASVRTFAANTFNVAKNAVATVANALTDSADAAENTGVNAVADTPELKEYTVVINYVFENNETAGQPYSATLQANSDFTATVKHPTVMGYLPYVKEPDAASEADETSTKIELDIENIQKDVTYTVIYKPTNVDYTVIHYHQNVNDDNYTEFERETRRGLTKSNVPDVAKTDADEDYKGFYALLYDHVPIAADGSTVVEVYYDRDYVLVNFDLDGGYGTEPVYARYGASLAAETPTKAGHKFLYWSLNGVDEEDLPKTVPAENVTYKAVWRPNNTASVKVVFWGENPNDNGYSYVDAKEIYAKPGISYSFSEDGGLICGYHNHDADCYKLICTKTSHNHENDGCELDCNHSTHTIDCYGNPRTSNGVTNNDLRAIQNIGNGNPESGYVYTIKASGDRNTYYYFYYNGQWYKGANVARSSEAGDTGTYSYSGRTWTATKYAAICSNHVHGDECYTCGEKNSSHIHTNYTGSCYELDCDEVTHTHTNSCYDNLTGLDSDLWEFKSSETQIVNADGSTIVNVYYDRKEFTLTFRKSDSTVKTITKKWGADIHSEFPIKNGDNTMWWTVPRGCQSMKPDTQFGSLDTMPAENITFNYEEETQKATLHYYVEALPGSEGKTAAEIYNGFTNTNYPGIDSTKKFTSYKDINITTNGVLTYTEEFHNITGFRQYVSYPEFDKHEQGGTTDDIKTHNYLLYARNSFDIVFYNPSDLIKTQNNVPYQMSLSGYYWEPAANQAPAKYEPGSVKFDGWYLNPDCTGEKFNFNTNTMPAGPNNVDGEVALALYAKWVPITHTVSFYLDRAAYDSNTPLSTHPNVTVPHGHKVGEVPAEPTNSEYKFVTWFYLDNGVEKAFDFANMPVNKDMKVYGKWSSDVLRPYFVYFKIKDTETQIADPITGSAPAATTKTFDAKGDTELYPTYREGYFPLVQSHSMTLEMEGDNVFTFYYVPAKEVPYKVYYVTETENEVNGQNVPVEIDGKTYYTVADTYENSDNKKAVVTETFKPVNGYMPNKYQQRLVLDGDEPNNNKIIFIYKKDELHAYYKITHYTQNTDGINWTEYNSSEVVGDIGTTYTAQPLTIPGFTYNPTVAGTVTSGELTAEGLELKLYYERNKYPYEVRYLEKNTGKVLHDPKSSTGKYGQVVSESSIAIPGYTVDGDASQTLVIRIEDSVNLNVITFYYVESEATINYVVVGPVGSGTVTPGSEALKILTGTASGSTATASTNYKFVGWYSDAACTQKVSDDAKFVPTRPTGGWPEETTYYAKFELDLADLTITKTGCKAIDENQCFLFTVTGPDDFTIDVVIYGNGSVTIKDLKIGTYTVTENTDWSWRYTPDKKVKTITLKADGNTVPFTNERTEPYWLSGDCLAENRWNGNSGNVQPIARKEEENENGN